jgi:hypothetical protein
MITKFEPADLPVGAQKKQRVTRLMGHFQARINYS